jgi:hypothetical protein
MEQRLTKERIDYLFDYKDGKFYWKNPPKYHKHLIGKEAGTTQLTNGKIYVVIQIDGAKIKRGRLVFFYINGESPRPCVDHINGNSLDDRPENLRQATIMQNAWNHKTRAKKSKLPMGVRFSYGGKFVARIAHYGKTFYLGTFKTVEEAQQVYLSKREELYGEFA